MSERASRDRSPGRPCAHASIRSVLMRPSQVSVPSEPSPRGGPGSRPPPEASAALAAPGQPAVDQVHPLGPPAAGPHAQLAGGEGQLDRGRAGVVRRTLLRSHHRTPGQQVGVRRGRVRRLDGLGIGGDALLVPGRVGRDDPLGARRRTDPGVTVQAREHEQAAERLGHPDPARRGHRPLDRERVPEELLQTQQRDGLQALVAGQPGQGRLRVSGCFRILARQGLQRLALCHHDGQSAAAPLRAASARSTMLTRSRQCGPGAGRAARLGQRSRAAQSGIMVGCQESMTNRSSTRPHAPTATFRAR